MRTGEGSERRDSAPRADVRADGPSDAPLAIVYLAIICCALTAMLVLAVAAAT
jgi:hypothetical protein